MSLRPRERLVDERSEREASGQILHETILRSGEEKLCIACDSFVRLNS